MKSLVERLDPATEIMGATKDDRRLARESGRRLARHIAGDGALQVRIVQEGEGGEVVTIPGAAARLLSHILTEMGEGHAVTLLPVQEELTTQQAAAVLNVSRPFLVQLLDSRQIPSRRVGTHRRVMLHDVLAYKKRIDDDRQQALDELAQQAQELGMGY